MRPSPSLRWHLLILFGLAVMYGAVVISEYQPWNFLHGDGSFYAKTNRSLLDGTLEQRDYQPASWYEKQLGWNHELDPGWSNIALGADGEFYPKHAIIMPLVTTPLYALFGWDGLLLANVLFLMLALWAGFRISARYVPPEVAAAVVLALATLPIFTRSAYAYSNDIFYAALIAWAIERWLAGKMGWAGMLLGMALWAKGTNAIFALPMGAALLMRRRWRDFAVLTGVAAIPVAIHLAMNAVMFGHPLVTSYHRILVMKGGVAVVHSHTDNFNRGWLMGLKAIWGDRHEGLSHNAALALLGIPGLVPLARVAPGLALLIPISMAGYLAIYMPFEYTYARFFMPWAVLLAVPLAVSIDRLMVLCRPLRGPMDRLLARLGTRGVVAAVLVAALVAIGVGLAVRHAPRPWRAVDHLLTAKVVRGDGPRAIPCDYFNPRCGRWECAIVEREIWHRWGYPVGAECEFEDGSDGWLWMHPNPGVRKTITFDVPPGPLVLRYGLSPKSRYGGARLRVHSNDKLLHELTAGRVGKIQEMRLAADERGPTVMLEVPAQAHDWRQLCVDLRHLDAER